MRLARGYILPIVTILIGVALIVRTLLNDGGSTAVGLILGVLLIAAGVGRIYVERSLR